MIRWVNSWEPRWRVAAFLGLAGALNYADRAAFSAVLQPLRDELALTDVTLGLLSSLFLWSYAVGSPIAGFLADRWPRGRVVVASLIVWSAVTAATGLATTFWQLAALRILLGFSECLFLPAAFALLADHHGAGTRARAMSILSMGVSVGVVAGGAAAGYFAELFGWRYGIWILGGLGILVALTAGLFVSEPAARSERVAAEPVVATLKFLAGIRTYHVILAKVMLAGFAVWIFLSWLPLYFRENFQLGLGAAGFAGTFMLQIMATVGIAAGGWLSDTVARKDPRRRLLILAVSYSLIAPMLLIFFSQPGLVLAIVIVSASSLMRGMGDATEKPSLCEVVPPCYRATAFGLTNALATAAGGVGVFLAGWLKQDVGLNGVFAACAGVYFVAAGLLVLAYRFWMAGDIVRMRQFRPAPTDLSPRSVDVAEIELAGRRGRIC
jgi:predicted MFS family arabinose efflux permease